VEWSRAALLLRLSDLRRRRSESRTPDRCIPHCPPLRPRLEGPRGESTSAGASGRPIGCGIQPRRPGRRLTGHATRLTSEGRVMMCQHCGRPCVNRTEGRPVRLAGKDLFFCNVCSLQAMAGSAGGGRESICGVPRAAPQTGELGAPPEGR
jgi:hypothetical protein